MYHFMPNHLMPDGISCHVIPPAFFHLARQPCTGQWSRPPSWSPGGKILSFGLLERNILISCWHFTSDTQVLDKYLRPGGCGRPHGKEPSRCTQTHSLSVPEQTMHVSLHEFLVGNLHVWHRGQHNAEQAGQVQPRRLEVGEDPPEAPRGGLGGGWRCTGSGS